MIFPTDFAAWIGLTSFNIMSGSKTLAANHQAEAIFYSVTSLTTLITDWCATSRFFVTELITTVTELSVASKFFVTELSAPITNFGVAIGFFMTIAFTTRAVRIIIGMSKSFTDVTVRSGTVLFVMAGLVAAEAFVLRLVSGRAVRFLGGLPFNFAESP